MKISCQSCQAKYTIADEKVVGKIVKIRCKKCGATIVINGNEDAAAAGASGGPANGAVADYTAQSDDQWTVNVAEGDQRTMSVHEIMQEYKGGVVTDDTYCWKDGMNDWLPLREIGDLYAACTLGPAPALHTSADGFSPISLAAQPPSMAASPPSPTSGEGDTVANVNFGLFGGGGSNGVEKTEVNGGSLFGSGSAPPPAAAAAPSNTSSTAAARRQGGRATGNADLFGTAAQAGSEADVMTSAATANANNDASKMTGARNENSVLFSLTALTNEPAKGGGGGGGGGGGRGETTAQGDGSGLIDIRALAQSMGVDDKNKGGNAKVDDIMNLSGGGAFSAALAAPVLAPPPADLSSFGTADAGGQPKNKMTLYAIIGGAAFLGLCILGAAFMFSGGKKDKEEDTKAAAPTTTETAPTATGTTPTPAASDTAQTGAVAQAPQTGSNTGATPPSTGATPGSEHHAGTTGSKPSGASPHTGGGTAEATPPPAAPAAPSKPKSLAEAMNDAVPGGGAKPAAPSGGGATAPFDRGAAAAALGGVNVQACKKPDGPTGPGKVRVTFEPNGSVSKVEFAEGSYAGTPVGGCILGKFRGAHIPAFQGAAVTAGKSFSVN